MRLAISSAAIFIAISPIGISEASADWLLRWQLDLPARKPAWEFTPRMPQDRGYEPILADKLVLIGCEYNGALLAIDADSGKEKWRFYTNAPIRFAPTASDGRIYLGSDDGYLYCLDLAGRLQWKFRGGPAHRFVIGHDRLMSAWPISTSPLVYEGRIYFAAGYWPVDGVLVHALEAATGKVVWTNSTSQFRPYGRVRASDGILFVDGNNGNAAFDLRTGAQLKVKQPKQQQVRPPAIATPGVKGTVVHKSVNDSYALVATSEGTVYCFADIPGKPAPSNDSAKTLASNNADSHLARQILAKTKVENGYCLVAGLEDGSLVEGLLRSSKLYVVAMDSDRRTVDRVRHRLDAHGMFNEHRLSVIAGQIEDLPPYFARLIVTESTLNRERVWHSLRPYGGALVQQDESGGFHVTRREGPLKGAADWTHEFCDPANTLASRDKLVKAPLGLLWYGGVAADARFYFDGNVDHQSGNGLNPQPVPAEIVSGRMILQGPGRLAAFDIYTGQLLWESPLPTVYTFGGGGGGLGIHSKKHPFPWKYEPAFKFDVPPPQRCRASGFNFVSLPDAIYVAAGRKLLRFDLETGKQLSAWPAPDLEPDLCWGSLRIDGDRLVATLFRPQDLIDAQAGYDGNGGDWAGDRMPMAWLVVLDRHAGKVEWKRKANWGFVNRSGIALGAGKIFCVDLVMPGVLKKWKSARRTLPEARPMLYALDIASGKEIWSQALDVRVKNIAYSEERDLLLAPCRNLMVWKDGEWRDLSFDIRRGKTNRNAPGKMLAFQGSSGKIVWQVDSDAYFDPHIVLHDLIIDRHGVTYDLRTGKRHQRKSSLTGQPEWWSFRKSGCNHLIACENLVTWRTAFFDLEHQSGVCSLTGMDAGCSPTLLPAGGILNIPNFGTHHKRNRMTAMALVHRPDNQLWTRYFSSREGYEGEPAPIRQAGFNFGAPGDRIADDGTLWLQVAQQNKAFVTVQPKEVEWFQHYAGSWIAGSGIIGVETIRIPVVLSSKSNDNTSRHYTIRLYFFEPENRQPGQRVFDVQIEGKTVLSNVDISKEAGIQKAIVRELDNVEVRGPLDIRLVPKAGKTILSGIELRRH